MTKRIVRGIGCLLAALMVCFCVGCKDAENAPKHETVTLNTVDNFFCNGTLVEANIRELTYDGNDASVRIRFTNIGDDPIDGIDANVRFLDKDGNLLFAEELHIAFEVALYKEESVSANVSCSGRSVRDIAAITVVDWGR